jgi:hypothetical protein
MNFVPAEPGRWCSIWVVVHVADGSRFGWCRDLDAPAVTDGRDRGALCCTGMSVSQGHVSVTVHNRYIPVKNTCVLYTNRADE